MRPIVIKIIMLILLALVILLLVISSKETIPEDLRKKVDISKATECFYKAGIFVNNRINKKQQSPYFRKLYENQKVLEPAADTERDIDFFFIKKIALSLMILTLGLIIINMISLRNIREEGEISEVKRSDYEQGNQKISLKAFYDDMEIDGIELEVSERRYTDGQLEEMLPAFTEDLEKIFIGENASLNFVNKSVCPVDMIQGYPFEITWSWDNHDLIDRKGNIGSNIASDGELMEITAKYTYEEYNGEYCFAVVVYPAELSREEYVINELGTRLLLSNEESIHDETMKLPEAVDGIKVVWTKEKKDKTLILFAGVIVSAVLVFAGFDRDLFAEVERRNEQMLEDYPDIVSKLLILVGAGMSMREAWRKIAFDYRERKGARKRYAYEEMLITAYEMESGLSEEKCYQRFATRCRLQKYVKLSAILEQSLKKGNQGMMENLKCEAADAFENRKSTAEKKGEQAGTKLLLPMMLMLLIVMVVIMYPAMSNM